MFSLQQEIKTTKNKRKQTTKQEQTIKKKGKWIKFFLGVLKFSIFYKLVATEINKNGHPNHHPQAKIRVHLELSNMYLASEHTMQLFIFL